MRVAGVMSGTSLDGIDVAIVELRGRTVKTIGFESTPYSAAIRQSILQLGDIRALSRLNVQLAELYTRAIQRAIRRFGPVELIGCHGQTVHHEGGSNTLQIGDAAVIAERLGVPVVSNFRARDIAAGGQGAPLVPFVDYLLFRSPKRTRIALNIGGIANITVIPPAASPDQVIAFDTGPGNMVIDALAMKYSRGNSRFDRGGKIAANGHVNASLLNDLMKDAYYRRKPPKSAGREEYGAEFVARLTATKFPLADLIATATVLTARTIAQSVREYQTGATDLIVSGGGAYNPQIMAHLTAFLPGIAISTSTDHGVDANAKEAIAFAVLAHKTWQYQPSNLPSATGARRPVVLGNITP